MQAPVAPVGEQWRPGGASTTRRYYRIEKTMQPGRSVERNVCKHILNANNPFAIALEMEVAGDARVCAVSTDKVTGSHPTRRRATPLIIESHHQVSFCLAMSAITRPRQPGDACE